MKELVKSVKENIGRYTMILVALFIVIVFQILTKGMVLKPMNLNNLIIQNAYIIILAVGQMMLVLAGVFDTESKMSSASVNESLTVPFPSRKARSASSEASAGSRTSGKRLYSLP